jgi:hypothetical protein
MIEQGRESEVLLDRVVDVLVLIEVHQVTGAFFCEVEGSCREKV